MDTRVRFLCDSWGAPRCHGPKAGTASTSAPCGCSLRHGVAVPLVVPDLRDHLSLLIDELERRQELVPAPPSTWSTGLRLVDQLTGGPGPGGWLIRGGAGAGSTALVVTFVAAIAYARRQPRVHVLTADLSPEELTIRVVACAAELGVDRLRSETLLPAEWTRMARAVGPLAEPEVRITDARGWSQPELERWCIDERPDAGGPVPSFLVIDGIDRVRMPGVVSLPRLERLSGRHVVATMRNVREQVTAATLVTTLRQHEHGRRRLTIDRSRQSEHDRRQVGISIDATSLRARAHAAPLPGAGQLRLTDRIEDPPNQD